MPHLNHPTRTQADAALQAIADEDRKRLDLSEATARFYARKTPKEWFQSLPIWKQLMVVFFGGVAVAGLFLWWFIYTLEKVQP